MCVLEYQPNPERCATPVAQHMAQRPVLPTACVAACTHYLRTMFKILHTSDWHLGRGLYGQNRHTEFSAFLDWLLQRLRSEQTDALLVAGDVFDTTTPNHAAQELYYRFLAQVAATTHCRHMVIIGGNHDSASFLNAPKALLQALNVHVVGAACGDVADEVLLLRDGEQQLQAIVCAVPYLRDRDVRLSVGGESIADKSQALLEGISQHYQQALEIASDQRAALNPDAPIIAMGHLFTQGGITLEADGVRELYVGSLAHVDASCFQGFDYVALGHLHVPQTVAGQEHIRYSGSPLPMGFGEAKQQKQVLEIAFTGRLPHIHATHLPSFQVLERIVGHLAHIQTALNALMQAGSHAYVEVVYQGDVVVANLSEQLQALVANSHLRLLRVYNRQFQNKVMAYDANEIALPELGPQDVFEACMAQHQLDSAQQTELRLTYQQVLYELENDMGADS